MQLPSKEPKRQTDPKYKKRIDNIKSAGQWATVLGWLTVVFVPITGLFTSTLKDIGPFALYVIALPFALYLIIAGKYIKKLGGRHIGKLMLISALVCFVGAVGIVPLFTLFTSIAGYVSFRKLKNSGNDIPFAKNGVWPTRVELLILAAFVVGGLGLLYYGYNYGGVNTSATNSNISSGPSTDLKEFTSVENGFKVNLPGKPSVEHQSVDVRGSKIPYTSYTSETDKGNKATLVAIYDYTGYQLDEKGSLEGAVNGIVQNTKGAQLVSSNFTTYSGFDAIESYYKVSGSGQNYDAYARALIKNNKMYAIITFGESKTLFYSIANSFVFTE